MKRILVLLILTVSLNSCYQRQSTSHAHHASSDSIPTINLMGKSYRFGPVLNDTTCKVEAPCDCCATDILFTDEHRFIAIFLCLQDDTYAHGSYRIDANRVYLSFEGKKVDYLTDMQVHYDSLSRKDTLQSLSRYEVDTMPQSIDTLMAFLCHGVLGFKSNKMDYGLPEGAVALDIQQMQKDSILDKMEYK
jgi:hypothetical protein